MRPTLFGLLVLMATQATAETLVVVPGGSAGYLYFPAAGSVDRGQQGQVHVVRDGSFGDFRIASEPSGLNCSGDDCQQVSARFPVGTQLTLRLEGEYAPGMGVLPDWFDGCQATQQSHCTLVVSDRPVTVRVRADFIPGAAIRLPEGGQAIYVGQVDTRYLVAARTNQGSAHWATQRQRLNANSQWDGNANMALIPDNNDYPAARLCRDLPTELGSGWYLPAISELGIVVSNRDSVGNITGHYWSSTEDDDKKAYSLKTHDGKIERKDKDKEVYNVRCVRSF